MPVAKSIPILHPDEDFRPDNRIIKRSSIDQFESSALHIVRGGRAIPLSWDKIDYVDCKCVHSHRVMSGAEDGLGYNFPVGTCRVTSDTYAIVDDYGERTEQLPAWFGEGFYKKMVDRQTYVNSDVNSLGVRNKETLRIGLDYYMAEQTLLAEE